MAGGDATDPRDPMMEHERLVAYVHAVNGDPEPRTGVWREHSYARGRSARGGGGAGGGSEPQCRLLLAPPRAPDLAGDDAIDIETVEPPPAAAPDPPAPFDTDDTDDDDDDDAWAARVEGAAGAAGARVVALLRALRLARLAGAGDARDTARLLRRALAPLWRGGGAQRLHAALSAGGGRAARLYGEVAGELARLTPVLAARLTPAAREVAAAARAGPAVMPMPSRPLLVWLGSGCDKRDARWERRLRALVPTHLIRLPNQNGVGAREWAAGAWGAASAALRALAGSCEGALALGGAGAGGALAAALARREGRARGVVLVAPRGLPPPPPAPLPVLLAAAAPAAARWHAPRTRLLLVAGADAELRLPRARRARLRVPQRALDAAIAEECARWLTELAEGAIDGDAEGEGEDSTADIPEPRAPLVSSTPNRAIEIVEGRVVSRACGAVPLALPTPRRAPPAPAPVTPVTPPAPTAAAAPKYTKVIVAKRAAGGVGGSVLLRGGVRLLRAPQNRPL